MSITFLKGRDKKFFIVCTFFLIAALVTIMSFGSGVSLHLEAYYIALPYRFVLGDRPFIDEYSFGQVAGFFTYPFFKLFYLLKHSTEGIFLYARYLHFVVSLGLASIVFFTFKKVTTNWLALLLAIPCFVFAPYNIHGLSYNNLATFFLTAGCFLAFSASVDLQKIRYDIHNDRFYIALKFILAGIFHANMIIIYPPLALVPLLFLFILGFSLREIKSVSQYSLGMFLGGFWAIIFFWNVGVEKLLISYNYAKSFGVQGGGFEKILSVWHSFWIIFPHKLIVLILLSAAFFLRNRAKKIFPWIVLAIVVIILAANLKIHYSTASMFFLTNIVFLLPALYFLVEQNAANKKILFLIAIPAFIAGVITSWTSGDGMNSGIVGFFPATLVAFYFMAMVGAEISNKEIMTRKFSPVSVLSVICCLMFLVYCNFIFKYEDEKFNGLHTRINVGPLKGIYTTSNTAAYCSQLFQDLKDVYQPGYKILFFDYFPAGYLFTNMNPATNTVWLFSKNFFHQMDRQATVDYYHRNHIKPNIIFNILNAPSTVFTDENFYKQDIHDPIFGMLKNYKLELSRPGYKVYTVVSK